MPGDIRGTRQPAHQPPQDVRLGSSPDARAGTTLGRCASSLGRHAHFLGNELQHLQDTKLAGRPGAVSCPPDSAPGGRSLSPSSFDGPLVGPRSKPESVCLIARVCAF